MDNFNNLKDEEIDGFINDQDALDNATSLSENKYISSSIDDEIIDEVSMNSLEVNTNKAMPNVFDGQESSGSATQDTEVKKNNTQLMIQDLSHTYNLDEEEIKSKIKLYVEIQKKIQKIKDGNEDEFVKEAMRLSKEIQENNLILAMSTSLINNVVTGITQRHSFDEITRQSYYEDNFLQDEIIKIAEIFSEWDEVNITSNLEKSKLLKAYLETYNVSFVELNGHSKEIMKLSKKKYLGFFNFLDFLKMAMTSKKNDCDALFESIKKIILDKRIDISIAKVFKL